jgi:large subunit ribosomal protein L16
MLMPKKTKYRKVQRGRMKGISKGARTIEFGDYGLVAVEPAWISARQIESLRISISRKIKKVGALFLRVFPDKPITKKPAETRMGKGKGSPEFWVAVVKRGRIIVEVGGGLTREEAKKMLQDASYKLPIKTRFVSKEDLNQKTPLVSNA